jgi:hypothetical protein
VERIVGCSKEITQGCYVGIFAGFPYLGSEPFALVEF